MTKIVVIGSLNMDVVAMAPRLPLPGETILGTQFRSEPGGKGANQAYAAAKLGGDVSILGRVGKDGFGQQMRANLAAVGCNINGLGFADGSSGVAMIFVADSGQNSIVVVPGANYEYRPADLRADSQHLAGAQFALLQLETPMDTVIEAAQLAKRLGVRVILDPAPAPASQVPELFRCSDILTPNETEAALLVQLPPCPLSVDDASAIARKLQERGAKTVIIKLGAKGCLLAEGHEATLIPAPTVIALDTTGAGDVFNAALAVACSEGASLPEGCKFAVHAAALSVTRLGAQQGMPTRAEVVASSAPVYTDLPKMRGAI
jgi:ribokinase